ncbi:MAG: choice-of-anchor D domain-containing protein [Bryobacteraceae bacterium]
MKRLSLALLFCASLSAQSLTFFIHDPTGANPDQPLPSPYTFADTPIGSTTSIVIRVFNPSTTVAVSLFAIFVGAAPNSSVAAPGFIVKGVDVGSPIAPQESEQFTLKFEPLSPAPPAGYLQALENTTVAAIATLQGSGTPPQLTLTCTNNTVPGTVPQCDGVTPLLPSNSALLFGNIPTTGTSSIAFTLTNNGTTVLNPQTLVSLVLPTNNPNSAFGLSVLPDALAASSSTTFTVTFSPGAGGNFDTPLAVGSNTYTLQGFGASSTLGDISSLVITYTDATGVRLTAQPLTPINFGATGAATLSFTVTNPQTTIDAVTIPAISVSGAGFTLSGVPQLPVNVPPNQSITFQIVFSESQVGVYSGTLSIGGRSFGLTGIAPQALGASGSALPGIALYCGASPCSGQTFTSQQQIQLSLQLNAPAPTQSMVTLAVTFNPSVPGVSDDPAIEIISPITGRTVEVVMPAGSETGIYNGQSQLTLQTGTTAGTITFTLTYLGQAATLATIAIPPALVQVTSAQAQRESPNLAITVNGYDNTYSVGQLSFTFYDTTGRVIPSSPFQASAVASDFSQYFFGPNDLGGQFSVQVTFPVLTGDVTDVGSVAVSLTNSVGTTAPATQAFQ